MGVQVVDFNPFEMAAPSGAGAAEPAGFGDAVTGSPPQTAPDMPMRETSGTGTTSAGAKGSGKGKAGKPEVSNAARDEIMRVLMPAGQQLGAMNDGPGFEASVRQVGGELRGKAREARMPFYEEAFRAGADGFSNKGLESLTSNPLFARAMQRADSALADRASVPELMSTGADGPNGKTLEYWHEVRQRLDDMYQSAKAAGSDKAEEIDQLRQNLRDKLNGAFPKYAAARGSAESFFNASDPYEAGVKFARGRYPLVGAQQAIATMNGDEKKLFTEGFMTTFVEDVRKSPDRAAVLDRINGGETGKSKVQLALGGKAGQVEAYLRLEGLMGTKPGEDPATKMAGLITKGSAMTETPVNPRVALHIAGMLTSKNPDIFLQGLQQAGKPEVLEGLRMLGAGNGEMTPASEAPDQKTYAAARDAIDRGADRTAVMKRLSDNGFNPRGM